MELKHYKRNTILFMQGEYKPDVYIVKRGVVRMITSDREGSEKHVMIVGPGSLLGVQSGVDGYPCLFTAVTAEENCEIYRTSNDKFFRITKQIEGFKDFLLRDMSMKMRVIAGNIDSLSFQSVHMRIIRAFFYLTKENGISTSKGIKINITFTQQEMADLIHSNRVTVSRFFGKLKKDGVLEKHQGYYYIKDMKRLYHYQENNK